MMYYWFHRASHGRHFSVVMTLFNSANIITIFKILITYNFLSSIEINFFWASHQTHHSSEDYNFTTALRQSVFQGLYFWVRRPNKEIEFLARILNYIFAYKVLVSSIGLICTTINLYGSRSSQHSLYVLDSY
jgi:hypothetical protein